MKLYKIAIMVSGNGSNFEAIVKYFKDIPDIKVVICISNKENAYAIARANALGIKNVSLELSRFENRKEHEKAISKVLEENEVELVVLAGYMMMIKFEMLKWCGKILNIHPSLLPQFSGVGAIERTFNSEDELGGITIHYIDKGMDTGQVVKQVSIKIDRSKGLEHFEEEIHKLEHQHYPVEIEKILRRK